MHSESQAEALVPLVLYAAGGHSKSVISTVVATPGWQLVGLINVHPEARPETILGFPVLGDDSALPGLLAQGVQHVHVCMGDNAERAEACQRLRAMGFELASIIPPESRISLQSQLGAGSFMHLYSVLDSDVEVGEGCIIQPFTNVGHDTRLGNYVQLAPGVHTGGDCVLDDQVFVGLGAAILPQVHIGRGAIIGANAVVRDNVPDYGVVAGNPGRLIRINPH